MEPAVEDLRRKFTVDDVSQMLAAGILGEDDRVELIEGELLVMSPQDPPHASVIERLSGRLFAAFTAGYRVRVQLPLAISSENLPEPDLAVVRGDEGTFDQAHPQGRDCVVVLEVSWSSRRRDLRKAEIYGRGGVPHYWRLDIEGRRLETYAEPAADGVYTAIRIYDDLAEVELPEVGGRWRVADLLPKR